MTRRDFIAALAASQAVSSVASGQEGASGSSTP
jgi:hypothetical protein